MNQAAVPHAEGLPLLTRSSCIKQCTIHDTYSLLLDREQSNCLGEETH